MNPFKYTLMKTLFFFFTVLLFCATAPAYGADITLMVIDNNSYLANKAVAKTEHDVTIQVVAAGELESGGEELRQKIDSSKIILVDVMGYDLEEFMLENITMDNKKVYALRGSKDDQRLKKKGFIFNEEIAEYYRYISKENIKNMLNFVANRHINSDIMFDTVKKKIQIGIFHPDADNIFTTRDAYLAWQKKRPEFYNEQKPTIGLLFFSSMLTEGQEQPIRTLIARLEREGFNILPCFGRDQQTIERFLLDKNNQATVDLVLSFTLKFYSALTPALALDLRNLNVPIISGNSLYTHTTDEWRASPIGIGGNEVTWSIASPENSGLIEPTPLSAKKIIVDPENGKTYFIREIIDENVDRLMGRLHKWTHLQRMANKDKKVAIMFYNHHQGKQNIGAAYLNVFSSLEEIIGAMGKVGYSVGEPPSAEEIKKIILTSARNVGSWAPGELDKMIQDSNLIRVSFDEYKKWFAKLPVDFKEKMIAKWGEPENSKIMTDGNAFIIPAVTVNNLILLPEPARGWSDEPLKLYHDTTLYPHHQYLAVYLWLAHGFKADAMIHLGTHSTYEWTPGKQAGLSPSCPPEVLIGDIPNIYPYIVDDVGEGIQAKRRGRGVIISHLTPMLKEADLYEEYGRMAELVGEYERAVARNSVTAPEKLKELFTLTEKTGILADIAQDNDGHSHGTLQHDHDGSTTDLHKQDDAEFVHMLGHYLEEIKSNLIPFGMHHFGKIPGDEASSEMAKAVVKWNPTHKKTEIKKRLQQSGTLEMEALLAGLSGRYIHPAQGNDPIRNPESLPTGKNFYGFNPNKIPSPAAWKLGKKAAEEIIHNHQQKHDTYPNKVAVVLWATETLRNEGVNESTILYLMGIKPRWSQSGRVMGVEVIPGKELKRPRIDVMMNTSGLYRDLFPGKIEFLDKALQLAIRQTDIDNILRKNSARIKTKLIQSGMSDEEAEELSRLRIFSEEPGSYGTGVAEMASSSGLWQTEREVVDVFENRMGFVFGGKRWGAPARKLLQENLAEVDVTMHSRSSNIIGVLDTDDVFQYLGGLSMAVRLESGTSPETLITQQQKPGIVAVEDLAKTLGREIRSRYLNPKWIEGMKKEDYAGAREIAHYVEYLWGWNMTNPEKVDAAKWQQTYEVYVEDKYQLELKEFFEKASPWAYQSMTARMLETVRKEYWSAPEEVQKKLAVEYVSSVVKSGVACCDHTCNNPMLNQMVISIVSLPGVMSPEMVEKFKLAIEQAAKKSLEQQVTERKELQQQLTAPTKDKASKKPAQAEESGAKEDAQTEVEGYKMEKMERQDDSTEVTSSGIEWLAGALVMFIIGLAAYGVKRSNR